jgi:hypothetical protein
MNKKKWRFINPETERFEMGKTYKFDYLVFTPAIIKEEGKECLSEEDVEIGIKITWNLKGIQVLE